MDVLSPTPEDDPLPAIPLPSAPRPPNRRNDRPTRSRSEVGCRASASHRSHRKTFPTKTNSNRHASLASSRMLRDTAGELEYLSQTGVNRTIASMVKVLFKKLPTSDTDVRLVLLEWLVSRLPQRALTTQGITVIPAESTPDARHTRRHSVPKGSKTELLMEKLQQKFDEETEIRRTQLDVGMTDEDVGSFREMFLHFNTDGTGGLDMEAVLKVIHTFGYSPSTRAINTSFDKLLDSPEPLSSRPADRADAVPEKPRTLSMPQFLRFMKMIDPEMLKKQAKQLGFSSAECIRFQKAFVNVDDDNSGLLTAKETLTTVRALGYTSSAKSVFAAFHELDTDKNAAIDFLEFLQLTKALIIDEEQRVLEICEFSIDEDVRYKYAFEKVDKAEKAVLTREDIMTLLENLDIVATEKECDLVMIKIDTKKTEVADYIDIMRFIATLRDLKAREEFRREQEELQKCVGLRPDKQFTPTDIFKFQRAFNEYVPENTGKLRKPEIYRLMKDIEMWPTGAEGQRRVPLILDSVKESDVTSTEPYFIEFEQFIELLRQVLIMVENDQWKSDVELGISLGFTEDEVCEFREVASLYDRDGNHTLELNEIQELLVTIGRSMPDKFVRELFKEYDDDNNGHLDFSEFLHLMKSLAG
eukprot:GEMP01019691.1.p1 GENE.GEMP01019691.1~~GEMP01019691.1.p1  ORF type:complete len:643 (+),score=150.06 GEMP01019691.1:235-2163(+)